MISIPIWRARAHGLTVQHYVIDRHRLPKTAFALKRGQGERAVCGYPLFAPMADFEVAEAVIEGDCRSCIKGLNARRALAGWDEVVA